MLPLSKQVADIITWARAMFAFLFVWLGFRYGPQALPAVVALMVVNWTGDSIDGVLARRSPVATNTWVGDHDLEIDMLISCGLLAYMTAAGYVAWQVAGLYMLLFFLLFWWKGILRAVGMLFQAPIYGTFIYIVLREAPIYGLLIVAWIIAAIIISWPKFPRVIVPGFLSGMRQALRKIGGHPDES